VSEYSKDLNFAINYNLYPSRYNTEEAILKRGGSDDEDVKPPKKKRKSL